MRINFCEYRWRRRHSLALETAEAAPRPGSHDPANLHCRFRSENYPCLPFEQRVAEHCVARYTYSGAETDTDN